MTFCDPKVLTALVGIVAAVLLYHWWTRRTAAQAEATATTTTGYNYMVNHGYPFGQSECVLNALPHTEKVTGCGPEARFPGQSATFGPSSLQFHHLWRFKQQQQRRVEFDTDLDHGLMVFLGPGMHHQRGGVLFHLRARDAQIPNRYNYGVTDPRQWLKGITVYSHEEDHPTQPALTRRRYWITHDSSSGQLRLGEVGQERPLITHYLDPAAQTEPLNFIGFGAGAPSHSDHRRVFNIRFL